MSKEVRLRELLQELAEQRGFDFRGYKKTTLERRFRKRMFELNLGGYAEYAAYTRQHPEEINHLLNTVLINVTEFFRDPPAWEILRHEILLSLLKPTKPGHSFRVWCAGCASGEEAYSVAMLLAEHFGARLPEYDIKIYGTDVDEDALNTARRGEYSGESIRRIRPEWRTKYFRGDGMMRVKREIRRLLIFGRGNLAQDAPISHVNLLICRNVLIYFDPELQKQILSRLHFALQPGGVLFLGKFESQLTNSLHFRRLNARWRLFQRITGSAAWDDLDPQLKSDPTPAPSVARDELEGMRLQQRYMLETLNAGLLVLDASDVVVQNNAAALSFCGLQPANLAGRKLQDTDLCTRTLDLDRQVQVSHATNETQHFQSRVNLGPEEKLIEVTLCFAFHDCERLDDMLTARLAGNPLSGACSRSFMQARASCA